MNGSSSETLVEIEGYSFAYHTGTPVVHDLNLELARGERLALLGPNGAGKSTLLLVLAGFLRGHGRIEIFGRPLQRGTIAAIRKGLGFLFQNPDDQLFMPTVIDNVAFGPLNLGMDTKAARERSLEVLRFVGFQESSSRLAHHLSLGQKRLVALAAILATEPELLLLDEPSAFLDPRGRARLARVVQELDVSLVVASHDLEFVRHTCTTAVVLDQGRVVARGPIGEVLDDDELLAKAGLRADFT